MLGIVQQFIPILWAGFLVNLEIGVAAVVIGLVLGVLLTLLRRRLSLLQRPIHLCIQLMQALPTYVTMFFVLTLLPDDLALWGRPIESVTAVVLAQSVYMTSYVAEDAYEALEHLKRNDRDQALLFLPNLLRGFVVVVMSSGFGAAVGVSEAVSVTMHQAERFPALGDRILLFAVTITFFVLIFGLVNILIQRLISRLGRLSP
jgi:His/Glu/Gln/Arg/opine family amino acid ABC transporter permease subunit